ncbi:hypothetical protein BLOT_003620 [Blomia tropicalis]|nr:hypothetical protein BLOT_003620 [Blomia tropicalis]
MEKRFNSKWCTITNDDPRSITHYKSYQVGKYLGLIGSTIICLGLFTWFFLHTPGNYYPPLTISITTVGIVFFLIATIFFFSAVYRTSKAQSDDTTNPNNIQDKYPDENL